MISLVELMYKVMIKIQGYDKNNQSKHGCYVFSAIFFDCIRIDILWSGKSYSDYGVWHTVYRLSMRRIFNHVYFDFNRTS